MKEGRQTACNRQHVPSPNFTLLNEKNESKSNFAIALDSKLGNSHGQPSAQHCKRSILRGQENLPRQVLRHSSGWQSMLVGRKSSSHLRRRRSAHSTARRAWAWSEQLLSPAHCQIEVPGHSKPVILYNRWAAAKYVPKGGTCLPAEWDALAIHLGGWQVAGYSMKVKPDGHPSTTEPTAVVSMPNHTGFVTWKVNSTFKARAPIGGLTRTTTCL